MCDGQRLAGGWSAFPLRVSVWLGDAPVAYSSARALGTNTFAVTATDNLGTSGTTTVTFTIVVTTQSIQSDVTEFFTLGKITKKTSRT